ncbi:hypothetical protein O59_000286 [Cellvibrio sp. BR]|nr:hypothetical protein O59_000286 [Cellvibrio sp. BR]
MYTFTFNQQLICKRIHITIDKNNLKNNLNSEKNTHPNLTNNLKYSSLIIWPHFV